MLPFFWALFSLLVEITKGNFFISNFKNSTLTTLYWLIKKQGNMESLANIFLIKLVIMVKQSTFERWNANAYEEFLLFNFKFTVTY